jgi:hypothetical protein
MSATTTTTAAALRRLEAVAAQDRPSARGLEGHLRVPPAVRAHRVVHLLFAAAPPVAAAAATATIAATAAVAPAVSTATATTTTRSAARLAALAAGLAAGRLVGQATFAVERLLTRGEEKLVPAVHAGDALVFPGSHDLPSASW